MTIVERIKEGPCDVIYFLPQRLTFESKSICIFFASSNIKFIYMTKSMSENHKYQLNPTPLNQSIAGTKKFLKNSQC